MNLNKTIYELDLDKKITDKLIKNNIVDINSLWILNRKKLKKRNFSDSEINNINIKLELLGIGLNKKNNANDGIK